MKLLLFVACLLSFVSANFRQKMFKRHHNGQKPAVHRPSFDHLSWMFNKLSSVDQQLATYESPEMYTAYVEKYFPRIGRN